MRAPSHIVALHAELLEKVALDASHLGIGAGSAALAGLGTYLLTHQADEERRRQTRNRSFGAGAAAGLATPQILRGVVSAAQNNGFLPGVIS